MLNQFYSYISTLLINYFTEVGLNAGDRYYLQMDNDKEVAELVTALKNSENVTSFNYKHELGDVYSTSAIRFENHKLVIANTSESVKPDFLVTLRNLVGEQRGEWENTSLISIVSEQLDSIQGGGSDLQKEGMPLHPKSLFNSLRKEIEESDLDKVDQIILQDHLDNMMKEQPFKQITFFEFEDIFATLKKGHLDYDEYYRFELFRDPEIDTFVGKDQLKRIEKNRELFNFVKKVQDYGLEKDELENQFSADGAKTLIKEDWMEVPFPDVAKFHEEYNQRKKNLKIGLERLHVNDNLIYWDKPSKDTTAGKRKRHIVIFNPEQQDKIEFQASFSLEGPVSSLAKEYLAFREHKKYKDSVDIQVKKTNIYTTIKLDKTNEPLFFKFSYKHSKKASLGAEFHIAILPINPLDIDDHKSKYLVDAKRNAIEIQYEDDGLKIGNGMEYKEVEATEQNQLIEFTEDLQLKILPLPESFNDEDELMLSIRFTDSIIPFVLRNELPDSIPIPGQRIWKLVRESSTDMEWIRENNRLVLGNREFYFHPEYKEFFMWEDLILENGWKAAYLDSDQLHEQNLEIGDELKDSFSRFVNYFRVNNTIPSLSHMSNDLIERAQEYIRSYNNEVMKIENSSSAGEAGIDLFRLGTVQSDQQIYFTPFHPLMVAYKLKYYELVGKEDIDSSIMNRLGPEALIPFIYDGSEQLYKPDHQLAAMEWLVFKPVNQVSVSEAYQYMAKVVKDKIFQFREHFSYLFMEKSQAPLQINVINISNDLEVTRGILQWMFDVITKEGPEILRPIEVTLYKENKSESSFDLYARTESVSDFEYLFGLNLRSNEYDKEDIVRMIREKLFFYKQEPDADYRYAHISFYKMDAQEKKAVQPMIDMRTGIALEGLLSSLPSMKDEENYRSGFGIKGYSISEDNQLTTTAYYVNELAANLRNGGNDSFRKGEAVFSRTTTTDEEALEKIFKSSYWVTFVDPTVDLEYFNNYNKNLVVIHYSDQYSSSSRYDAITVTDKSDQYFAVIKEFLKKKGIEATDANVVNTIKAFNTFNGEWLLRIIGSKGHLDREKLSIISAIKFSVSYFDHPQIIWIPISLEEVLRVAGAISLNKSDGVFTAKNLGVSGSHSDDLLLIGIEEINEKITIHFYPVEVKIGLNQGNILEKAREQVRKTKSLLIDTLTGEVGDSFKGKFYRNFFAQLAISSAKRLNQSNFWPSKGYDLKESTIEKLLKDDYTISTELELYSGKGAILSFQKNVYHRSAALDGDVLLLNLTHFDGYQGLVQSVEKMRQWIQVEHNDFIKEDMLSHQYNARQKTDIDKVEVQEGTPPKSTPENEALILPKTSPSKEVINAELEEKSNSRYQSTKKLNEEIPTKVDLKDTRILIGKAENSNREIYWEFGNTGLANRHLLISGKSGQGKTYFMQCLLLEKSRLGVPSIVIDYTEGFLPNQLESEFVQFMGNKLKQKIVYSDKLPINPFAKNVRDIGGIELPESNTDIAERIKSVFSAVYSSLGIQQRNAIYDATLEGLERYGEQMNLLKLKEMLEEEGSNYSKTALSQIRPLIDRNPFSSDELIKWEDIINSDGEVYIIQLTGFPRDVQLIITEFILWDLWNYSVQYGDKNKPIPVIMDEAQNLDHTENSPSARILTEGRKFGWSGWYATQFLKSQLTADELARLQNSSQKVYFSPPEQEVSNIASSLSKDIHEKRGWENSLAGLKKGQCIVHGPVLKPNGELSTPAILVVNISSLEERINKSSL